MTAEPEYPATWTWHGAPKAPGPAVIFDIDGVLADASGRQHHLAGLRRDWDAFFAECGEDPLIPEVARLLELLTPEVAVVLLTARPARVRAKTLTWLESYGLRYDLLVMREQGDRLSAREFKRAGTVGLRGTVSNCAWQSRTILPTSRCSSPKACPACTCTPVTTAEGPQSRKLPNWRGMSRFSSFSAAITAWRSSRFLPVTRT